MSSNKQSLVPEAREALDRFKMEAANDFDGADTSKTDIEKPLIYTCLSM